MKKNLIIALTVITVLITYSFTTFNGRLDDVLKSLGLPENDAKLPIWKNFAGTYFSVPSNAVIKNYPQNKRAAAVYEIGSYVKSYILSADFQSQYQSLREEKKPKAPLTIGDRIKVEQEEISMLLKESESAYNKASQELKPLYEASIKKYRQALFAFENDYDPQHAKQMEGILTQYEYDMGDYRYKLKQFEREYPADVRAFIKLRLQEFLQVTTNVDFNAELVERSGKKRFVNPAYEAKHPAWKYCFRAGKQSTTAARALAKEWLTQI